MNADSPAHDPVTDLGRLTEIADLDLFSAAAQERLDGFARRAAERFDLPIGLVTIVLADAQYLAGMHGVEGWLAETRGTPVEWSFCATAVRTGRPYVVPDAATDAVQAGNPLVTVDGFASYAGTPLITSTGHAIGAYCVLGTAPRTFTPAETNDLRAMADEVVAEIEAARLSAGV